MPVIENDRTRNVAVPAVIVAAIRSGGTFLTHCLSNHPAIFCDRGEPLHHHSVWCRLLSTDRGRLLRVLLNQPGYQVSMCRLTYVPAFHAEIWPLIEKRHPRVLWLRRANLIRQALSVAINDRARAGLIERPQHSFADTDPISIEIAPALFVRYMEGLEGRDRMAETRLRALPDVLTLTYEAITADREGGYCAEGIADAEAERICTFLGVPLMPMTADLRRINPGPISALLSNWREVRTAIEGSAFAGLVEQEGHWTL